MMRWGGKRETMRGLIVARGGSSSTVARRTPVGNHVRRLDVLHTQWRNYYFSSTTRQSSSSAIHLYDSIDNPSDFHCVCLFRCLLFLFPPHLAVIPETFFLIVSTSSSGDFIPRIFTSPLMIFQPISGRWNLEGTISHFLRWRIRQPNETLYLKSDSRRLLLIILPIVFYWHRILGEITISRNRFPVLFKELRFPIRSRYRILVIIFHFGPKNLERTNDDCDADYMETSLNR